jgi:hypothetical protein
VRGQINTESLDKLREIHRCYRSADDTVMDGTASDGGQPLEWRSVIDWPGLEAMLAEAELAIRASDGRAEKHALVLQTTQQYCVRLGAARVTCCKSGKDRTGMVRACRARFIQMPSARPPTIQLTHAHASHQSVPSCDVSDCISCCMCMCMIVIVIVVVMRLTRHSCCLQSSTLEHIRALEESLARSGQQFDSTVMTAQDACQIFRGYGVRRENVRMNTGSDRFAVNAVQRNFLPEE